MPTAQKSGAGSHESMATAQNEYGKYPPADGRDAKAVPGACHVINRWQSILSLEYFDDIGFLHRHIRNLRYARVGRVHDNVVIALKGRNISI